MVKSLYSVLIAFLIFIFAGISEQIYLSKTFEKLNTTYLIVYDKIQSKTANVNDVESVRNLWFQKKLFIDEELHKSRNVSSACGAEDTNSIPVGRTS